MGIRIGIGTSDFADLRESGGYYVDKTGFLYDLLERSSNKVTLITRPRRFGKTLMMSMMENFFNVEKDCMSLFKGLAITKHTELCAKYLNKYPVIYISLKDIVANDFESASRSLAGVVSAVCKKLDHLMDHEEVDPVDRQLFFNLKSKTADPEEVKAALRTMTYMLYRIYSQKVILLIDEYDVPLSNAMEKNYYAQMLDVMRGLMSYALKDNEYLQFAVVTGCLKISKESIFTGVNNFKSYSILDKQFSHYFGFQEYEVNQLLQAAGLHDRAGKIKEWYDGYLFGDSHMYCPWDVMNYVADLAYDEQLEPQNYWKNTSHNGVLLSFVKRTDFRVTGKFEALLNGGTVAQKISDQLTYDTLYASEDHLWSVLFMTGYLTKANPENTVLVQLKIPNKEIESIFEDTVVSYFKETIDNRTQRELMQALWNRDASLATQSISLLLRRTISYHDYHEDYYHAFLTGIFVGLGYEVDSNKEHGSGRLDILIKDEYHFRAIVIEAKKSKDERGMDRDCDRALEQIADRHYADDLYNFDEVLCYGIAFYRKRALVKCMTGDVGI